MYSTHYSSILWTPRTNGSLSFSFNEFSNLLNETFDNYPSCRISRSSGSTSCCCCCCCGSSYANYRAGVPRNPRLLYGLRQSSLIQCSPSRRVTLGGRDSCYYRPISNYGIEFDHACYEVPCTFNERSNSDRIGKLRNLKFERRSLGRRRFVGGFDDFEAVISLLTEEVSEECEYNSGSGILSGKRRESYGGEGRRESKKNACRLLESDSKYETESISRGSKKEKCRKKEKSEEKEETGVVLREPQRRERKPSSSFSSYYSVSSGEEVENDMEGPERYSSFTGESSSGYRTDSSSRKDKTEGKVEGKFKMDQSSSEEHTEVLDRKTGAGRTNVEWDLRKKSEKKLTEIEETQSNKETSHSHSRTEIAHEAEQRKATSSSKQIDEEKNKASLAVELEKGTKKYTQDDQLRQYSDFKRNNEETSYRRDFHGRKDSSSQFQKHFSESKENLMMDSSMVRERRREHLENVGESIERRDAVGGERVGTERGSTSKMQSESKMKILEEDRVLSSVHEINKQYNQTGKLVTDQTESQRNAQQLLKRQETHDNDRVSTSILQLGARRNQEGSVNSTEAKEEGQSTYQKAPQSTHPREKSQNVTNISVNITNVSMAQATDIKQVSISGGTSEGAGTGQGRELSLIAKPTQETRPREKQTAGGVARVMLRDEAYGSTESSKFQEQFSEEESLNIASQVSLQEIDVDESDWRSSRERMTPPLPQKVARDPLHIDTSDEIKNSESSGGDSVSSSALYTSRGRRQPSVNWEPSSRLKGSEFYRNPTSIVSQEAALVSAQRIDESSMHELSTSEIQMEKTISDTKLIEGYQTSLEQTELTNEQLKKLESRRSHGGSGVKGPSAEMWHVTEPSARETPQIEAPDGHEATADVVVRRTGRSLWNIISNIVRLRWDSRAEAPKPAHTSDGKSSSNDSVSSETWYSGHDADEISNENKKRERRGTSKVVTSPRHLEPRQTSIDVQGEAMETVKLRDKTAQSKAISPSSSRAKSGSWSTAISSPSDEENLGSSQHGQRSEGVIPQSVAVESSTVTLSSGGVISPTLDENVSTSRTDYTGSEEPMQQPVSEKLVLGSEGNAQLKQRRLQRSKQVLRDRFDDWEEAYIREREQQKMDEMFMREALIEAKKAGNTWEVPVGAVLVQDGRIISRGHNLVEELRDSTAHAEMICIREASNQLRTWRLSETTLYITLEPCPMCAGAILQSRISTLVWGTPNKLLGADGSWIRLFPKGEGGDDMEQTATSGAPVHPFHPNMTIRRGILASECADVMQQFFQLRRRKKQKEEDEPPQPSCIPIAKHQPKILTKMHDIFHALFCL